MFHVYGLSLFIMGLLSLGCTIFTMRKFDVDEMVRAIGRLCITHLHVVSPLLIALSRRAKKDGSDSFTSLKQVFCGAVPLSEKSIDEFNKTFPHDDFIQGYGMTESTVMGTRENNSLEVRSVGELWLRYLLTPGHVKGSAIQGCQAILQCWWMK